jgi:mRNA-degrading endonuclease RelE of RelBE toxin-antitoxin system
MQLKKKKKQEIEILDSLVDKICLFINPEAFKEYQALKNNQQEIYNPFISDSLNKIGDIDPDLISKIIGDLNG